MKRVLQLHTRRIRPALFKKPFSPSLLNNFHNNNSASLFSVSSLRQETENVPQVSEGIVNPQTVSIEEVLNLIRPREKEEEAVKYFLIDVRELEERKKGVIPSSIPINLAEIGPALTMNEYDFSNHYKFKKFETDDLIVFYCHSGKRSEMARKIAADVGYTNARNFQGSWIQFSKEYPELIAFDLELQ